MNIVPVIDLKGGIVVHARRGDRANYAPLISTLCNSPEPIAVATALISRLHPHAIYIADLDAIANTGNHGEIIRSLHQEFPNLEIWLDAGFRDVDSMRHQVRPGRIVHVIGSETIGDIQTYLRMIEAYPNSILSLDYRGRDLIGPKELLSLPWHWPRRVLHLNLKQVGSGVGPDLSAVADLIAQAPAAEVYSGGGVRDMHDLDSLAQAGASGALIATALHSGDIPATVIDAP